MMARRPGRASFASWRTGTGVWRDRVSVGIGITLGTTRAVAKGPVPEQRPLIAQISGGDGASGSPPGMHSNTGAVGAVRG